MTERVASIRRERFKWAEKAMEGTVPDDIARERQQLLAEQLLAAESALSRLSADQDSHEATLHAVLDLVGSCGRAYELSEPKGRRDYNQAFFSGIFLDVEEDEPRPKVAKVRRTPVLAALQEHREPNGLTEVIDLEQQRRQDQSLDGVDYVSVSNEQLLVELRGLEPLTFSLRTRRATDCAIAPRTGGPISTETLPPSGRGRLPRFLACRCLTSVRSRRWSVCRNRPILPS
jgi:site-specific DNA recombinase